MTEKQAQGNPAQPVGWAVDPVVNPDAHPDGELIAIEQQKRVDTAQWEDAQNRSPMDNVNPGQPPGPYVPEPTGGPVPGQGADAGPPLEPTGVVGKVFVAKSAKSVVGAKVVLAKDSEGTDAVAGKIVARTDGKFWTAWNDGENTVENESDYELVITNEPLPKA